MRSLRRKLKTRLLALPYTLRRLKLIWTTRLFARLLGIELELDIHPLVQIERGARIKFTTSRRVKITIREYVRLHDSFECRFYGNMGYDPELYIGPYSLIHRNVTFTVGGRLHLEGLNEIGVGTVIRANQSIEFGELSGSGEYASFFDFFHAFDEERRIYQGTVIAQPIKIGQYVMVAAKACVSPGTSLSGLTIVLPNSVVSGVHPPASVLGGMPAKDLDNPNLMPVMANPLMKFILTWDVDKPGPNFKSIDAARADVPDPQPWSKENERYLDKLDRVLKSLGLPPDPAHDPSAEPPAAPSGNGADAPTSVEDTAPA
ncbi:MAG: hypothetical protein IT198_04895 [Acidimicrobiia bacterium]|nr:hypothetical protein [Acidimicrobiia bacterium]